MKNHETGWQQLGREYPQNSGQEREIQDGPRVTAQRRLGRSDEQGQKNKNQNSLMSHEQDKESLSRRM